MSLLLWKPWNPIYYGLLVVGDCLFVQYMIHTQNVKRPFPMPILFYMTSSGRQPVMEFLESLLVSDRKEVMADIVTLRLSYPAAPPLVKKIKSGRALGA